MLFRSVGKNLKKYSLDYRASRGNLKVSSGVLGRWFGLLVLRGYKGHVLS